MARFVLMTAPGASRAISLGAKYLFAICFVMLASVSQPVAQAVSTNWLGGIPDSNTLAYEISRKGKRLGFQTIDFSRNEAGDLLVDVHIEFAFYLGPLPLFRYVHDNREVWRDGALVSLRSHTDNNGKPEHVDLRLDGTRFVGKGSRFDDNLTAPMLSSNYFNPNFIRQKQLISTQDGRLLKVNIETLGRETVLIEGHPVEATHFRLTGKRHMDIWYTDEGRWVRSEITRRGNTLVISQINPTGVPPRNAWRRP